MEGLIGTVGQFDSFARDNVVCINPLFIGCYPRIEGSFDTHPQRQNNYSRQGCLMMIQTADAISLFHFLSLMCVSSISC
ncbi:hypothetical protein BIY26_17240 [Brenneria goodwinii]|uniref:Uncharacterized protein n=1 Tax=Brenneria goodwinii TaxID=1109412 RepID=A0AAE8JM68_9GAMM|nr:hypothetical protein AWC36_14355 [Brenneria goodwinii]RLM19403.1 hypothetical protein BIY26_17240 [Brenneria goodwinii]RLM24102.1 hypothetical protein BIY28_05615 [Brenneria goodwinii]